MKPAGFVGCLIVEALKLRRTMALALAILLPAAPVAFFVILILSQGGAEFSQSAHPSAMIVLGLVGLWAVFPLPIFAAVESSLLASVEHQNRGWKHIFALPPARGSLIAAKFAAAALLVTIAHACLFVYALVLFRVLPMLEPAQGFDGPIPVVATLAVIAACAASSLFVVGLHTFIAMRWASFALNVGISLGGILYALGVLDTRQAKFIPWALPALVHKVAVPWIFDLPGAHSEIRTLTTAIAISVGGCILTAVAGGWLLSRRDVF